MVRLDSDFVQHFVNKLSIVTGFNRLLLDESAPDDPHRADVLRMYEALQELLQLLAAQTGKP